MDTTALAIFIHGCPKMALYAKVTSTARKYIIRLRCLGSVPSLGYSLAALHHLNFEKLIPHIREQQPHMNFCLSIVNVKHKELMR